MSISEHWTRSQFPDVRLSPKEQLKGFNCVIMSCFIGQELQQYYLTQ